MSGLSESPLERAKRHSRLMVDLDVLVGITEREPPILVADQRDLSTPIITHRAPGCICPPGAEKTCKGPLCPRRAIGESL